MYRGQHPQAEHAAVYEIVSQALHHLQRAHSISHYLARYPIHSSTEVIDYLKLKKEELEYYEKTHPLWADNSDSLNVGAFNMLSARVIDSPEAMQSSERSSAEQRMLCSEDVSRRLSVLSVFPQ